MSRETTEALAAARACGLRWADHARHCPACTRAVRARKPGQCCPDGAVLYEGRRAADAELTRNREADKAPLPGQAALF